MNRIRVPIRPLSSSAERFGTPGYLIATLE
jgi:hypothetical protein